MDDPYVFQGPTLKLERADQHIRDFELTLKDFTRDHGHRVLVHQQQKDGPLFFEILFDAPLPSALSLILSDAIHNLRTTLDHATWELLGIDQAIRNRHTKLPTGNSRVSFEAACKGIKTTREDTIEFFRSLAVYPGGGGETLYWLALLDNAEKHTILAPVVQAATVERIVFIDLATNERLPVTNVTLRPGRTGRSYLQTLPAYGIDCNEKFKTSADVFFDDVEGVPNQPILPTLTHFRDAVADTLRQFRRFFIMRP